MLFPAWIVAVLIFLAFIYIFFPINCANYLSVLKHNLIGNVLHVSIKIFERIIRKIIYFRIYILLFSIFKCSKMSYL